METNDKKDRKPFIVSEPDQPSNQAGKDAAHKAIRRAARQSLEREFEITRQVFRNEDMRFDQPTGWRYWWKPPAITFGFGIPGIVLIIAQLWLPEFNEALDGFLGGYVGLARLAMLFIGGWMVLIAAPLYKPAGWSPQKDQEVRRAREHYRNKRKF